MNSNELQKRFLMKHLMESTSVKCRWIRLLPWFGIFNSQADLVKCIFQVLYALFAFFVYWEKFWWMMLCILFTPFASPDGRMNSGSLFHSTQFSLKAFTKLGQNRCSTFSKWWVPSNSCSYFTTLAENVLNHITWVFRNNNAL